MKSTSEKDDFFSTLINQEGNFERQHFIWIDSNMKSKENEFFSSIFLQNQSLIFKSFREVADAITYIKDFQFVQFRIAISGSLAEEFLVKQKEEGLQDKKANLFTVFVFCNNEKKWKEKAEYFHSFLQCTKMCSQSSANLFCLRISSDESEFLEFCNYPNLHERLVKRMLDLVSQFPEPLLKAINVKTSGIPYFGPAISLDGTGMKKKNLKSKSFLSGGLCFQESPFDKNPSVLEHLCLPKVDILPDKTLVRFICAYYFAKENNIDNKETFEILKHFFLSATCWKDRTFYRYIARLWTKESKFYMLMNEALSYCKERDLGWLKYILEDYFSMYFDKVFPYYCGTLYRGVNVPKQEVENLKEFIDADIYFTCFTATTKNKDKVFKCNTVFEIQTIKKEIQENSILFSNADISSISYFPEEQEVLYPPLTVFRMESYENVGGVHVFKLRETSGGVYMMNLKLARQI